jgi:hypothetical protein
MASATNAAFGVHLNERHQSRHAGSRDAVSAVSRCAASKTRAVKFEDMGAFLNLLKAQFNRSSASHSWHASGCAASQVRNWAASAPVNFRRQPISRSRW